MCEEKAKEDWIRLSELAAVEKDPERLRKLIEQIIHLIDPGKKRRRRPSAKNLPMTIRRAELQCASTR